MIKSYRKWLWRSCGRTLFWLSPHNAYAYRVVLLRFFGMKCGRNVRVRRSVWINKPWNVTTGDLVMLGDGSFIHAGEPITIGKRCTISQHAMLITVAGEIETLGRTQRRAQITIEDDCWIATDTVVMPGSYIEEGVVVGARSLVDGRLPKWKVCVGEPALPRADRVLYGAS